MASTQLPSIHSYSKWIQASILTHSMQTCWAWENTALSHPANKSTSFHSNAWDVAGCSASSIEPTTAAPRQLPPRAGKSSSALSVQRESGLALVKTPMLPLTHTASPQGAIQPTIARCMRKRGAQWGGVRRSSPSQTRTGAKSATLGFASDTVTPLITAAHRS